MFSFKKLLAASLLAGSCLVLFIGFAAAQRPLEIKYPTLEAPGILVPSTTRIGLPEYIRYLFSLSFVVVGLIAFSALVYAGLRYLTSTGSPVALTDAKERIISAFAGIIILLSSYLILTTINPQLVTLKVETMRSLGVILYDDNSRTQLKVGVSQILDDNFHPNRIDFLSPGKVEARVCPNKDYTTGCSDKITNGGNLPFAPKSIVITWTEPGVYLYGNTDKDELWTNANFPFLDKLNDEVKKIIFKNGEDLSFAAILHEDPGYQGQCRIFLEDKSDVMNGKDNLGVVNKVSSATVFLKDKLETEEGVQIKKGEGIQICKEPNYLDCKPLGTYTSPPSFIGNDMNNKVNSIIIDGEYLAVLMENAPDTPDFPGKCQVFRQSDPDLKNDPIGMCDIDCGFGGFWCDRKSCVSAIAIYPIKK